MNNPNNFQVGDKVRMKKGEMPRLCRSSMYRNLFDGKDLVIKEIKSNGCLCFDESDYNGWFARRFEKVPAPIVANKDFTIGDTVEVKRGMGYKDDHYNLLEGSKYVVAVVYPEEIGVSPEEIGVRGARNDATSDITFWLKSRFKKAEPKQIAAPSNKFQNFIKPKQTQNPTNTMCRNRLGQFSSPSNPSAVKDVQFRRGSLYRIVGSGVARFKGVVDNLAVLTIHGKPTVVATERVKLADKEDVDLYLADARNR